MKNVETLYSLSPLQHGLLFHSLAEPESRVYQQQLGVDIEGELDEEAFRRAWELVVQRHPVLRTAFLWEGLDDAYQVVHKSVPLRLQREDWRLDPQRAADLAGFCLEQRQQMLALDRAPLQRLCLIRLDEQRWHFVWTHHHIVLDGWSVGLVLQDWFTAYRTLRQGVEPRFKPVRPYQDYIAWLGEQDADAARSFWSAQLAGFAEPTPLPRPDALPPVTPDGAAPYAEQCIRLDAHPTQALQQFARSEALTPATLVAAAWGLLLARHAGREEALFGLTVSGRPASLPGAEDMVGLFINTLPLRLNCAADTSVRDWLQQLQALSTELQERCHTPLSSLKALSEVPDGRSLFESIVVVENFPFDEGMSSLAEGLVFRQEEPPSGAIRHTQGRNNYALTLVMVPGPRLELILCYQRQLLSEPAAALLLAQMQALLQALPAQADRGLAQLDWLGAGERERLLAWGRGAPLAGDGTTLLHRMEHHARLHPDAPALATIGARWTYAELDEAVRRRAALLRRTLAADGSRQAVIALALPRSADFIMAMLACWKAGAAYLPLDIQQPPSRLRQILEDSEATLLVAAPELAAAIGSPAFLSPADLRAAAEDLSDDGPLPAADDIAYLIYTSGSTGQPKGVQISHRAALDYARGLVQALDLQRAGPGLRFGLVSTVAADLGLTSVFGAWASGGCLCLPEEEAGFDPLRFAAQMQSLAVDVLKITPSHLRGLLDAAEQSHMLPARLLIFGGEALDAALARRVRALAPGLAIVNHYGPTETTVGAVYRQLGHELPERGPLALGRPLPGRRLQVVDERGRPVAPGVPGELWIGGAALADGYLKNPDLTGERFVLEAGERFYRSGDRVRWTVDGELVFLGRVDRQIKLRGYRIELGEIEARLRTLSPQIEQVLVQRVEQDGNAQLVAYVVARTALSTDKLRQDLALELPDYMVPAAFVTLDALPLNANGKVDVRRLPLPGKAARSEQSYVAARDELEQTLVEIWQQVLKLERVGVNDSFFDLGGDSILNLQIVTRAQQRGLQLSPKQVFEQRTVAALAQALRDTGSGSAATLDRPLPLSAGQLERLRKPLAPEWRCLHLRHAINLEQLAAAVHAVQAHHAGLQLGLRQGAQGWEQHRLQRFKTAAASRQTVVDRSLDDLAGWLFSGLDSAGGELLHAALLDEDGARLLLVAHPLAIDETGWGLLLRDLALALEQLRAERPLRLSFNGGDFDGWLQAQVEHARSEALEPAWEEWLQYAGTERPRLPVAADAMAQACRIELDECAAGRLNRLRRALGVEWPLLVAVAVCQELHEALDSTSLVIALDAGRPAADALPRRGPLSALDVDPERLLGCLLHRVPLFIDWPATAAPLQQIHHLTRVVEALPLRGADYGAARYLSEDRFLLDPLLTLPEAQIAIGSRTDEDDHLDAQGCLGEVLERSRTPTPHALQICAVWSGDTLQLELQGALAAHWSERLAARLETLAAVTDFIQAPLPARSFAGVSAEELVALALDWAQVETLFPVSPMQHGLLFESRLAASRGDGTQPYRVHHRYEWRGPLDSEALQHAWDGLHAQHAMLRSGFVWRDEQPPLQIVYRNCDSRIEYQDWSARPDGASALDELLQAERVLGLNLERPPLDRLRLFRLGEDHYILVRSYHHVLSDAWSFGTLIEELFVRYEAARRGQSTLHALPRPYRDYLRWLERQDSSRAEAYWRRTLADLDGATTSLPVLQASAAPARLVSREQWLGVAETQQLESAARESQTTLNTWLQLAWALLLSRYSGTDDVVFGTTVAGRPAQLADIDRTVGLFINTLPLRVKLDEKLSVAQCARALLAQNVEQRELEHSALGDILRWSGLPRTQALFETILVFENAPSNTGGPALDYRIDLLADDSPTHYPLSLIAMPGDRLGLRLYSDSSRITEDAAERLLDHLAHLLRQLPAAAENAMATLELLTPAERQRILVDWNRSEADFPLHLSYGELMTQQAQRQAHKIAASCGGRSLSYAELEQGSNRVARHLAAAGAGPDTLVALLAERGLDLLTMMIGTLKAGAAFQALDTGLPERRLGELLELGRAPILLASREARQRFSSLNAASTLVAEELMAAGDDSPMGARSGPDHLAYVVFTSGSTGLPKGAMVEQRGLLNNLFGKIPALGLNDQDRVAQTAALSFDISIWQFLAAPLVGAQVHIVPDEITHDPRRLLSALDEQDITLAQTVPSMLRAMLDDAPAGLRLTHLRWMISIGEALPPALCRRWFQSFDTPLMNLYGPAECADNIGFHALTEAPPQETNTIPVGRPTANNQLYVLDRALRPVPVGVPGEICSAGFGVGRGYLNDAARSAEAFVPHPFQAGARFYRTGDIGRFRADGSVEYLGRRDQQIKIRGQRIELGDIEHRIGRHPAVAAAAVVVHGAADGDPRLIAYWQARDGQDTEPDLRAALAAELTPAQLPARFIRLDALPLNVNGKTDRKRLAALDLPTPGDGGERPEAVWTETENRLAPLWAAVFPGNAIERESHFFELGGHSLLAAQLVARIRAAFSVDLPLKTLFERPQLAALALAIEQQAAAAGGLEDISPQSRTGGLPLSHAQQRLWFMEQLRPGSGRYNIPFLLRLRGALAPAALQAAFLALIRRQEVLRTVFVNEGGQPVQRAVEIEHFPLPVRDLTSDDESAIRAACRDWLERPFDLRQAPLLRVGLLRLADDDYVLAGAIHHIATDAWSLSLLVEELAELYRAVVHAEPPRLPEPALHYADYAAWQRRYLQSGALQQQLAYWRQTLQALPEPLHLPGRQLQGETAHPARLRTRLSADLAQQLERFALERQASLFMLLQAGWAALLHLQTGRDDIVLGTDVSNRRHPASETMQGFFVNQLVLRHRVQPELRFEQVLDRIRHTTLAALEHQDLPFDVLVAELAPQRQSSESPLFQVKLVLQNAGHADFSLPGISVEELASHPQAVALDLQLNAVRQSDGLELVFDFDAQLYPEARIASLATAYADLLSGLTQDPTLTLAQWQARLSAEAPEPERRPNLKTAQRRRVTTP